MGTWSGKRGGREGRRSECEDVEERGERVVRDG